MNLKKIESDAVLLAAGRQTRYNSPESKLMAYIDGRPAFHFTLKSILEVFPEEMISIVSSILFQDFNDFVSHKVQKAKLLFDSNPGSGSAHSLRVSMPWEGNLTFVSEGNIYFENYLIYQLFQLMQNNTGLKAALAVTPRTYVAPTHRKVFLYPELDLTELDQSDRIHYRNIGAYVFRPEFQDECEGFRDIIQVLNHMNIAREGIGAFVYNGEYLHIATVDDVIQWQTYFDQKKI